MWLCKPLPSEACGHMVISFLPLILKNAARAMMVENVRMAEMADATPSFPRMIWE